MAELRKCVLKRRGLSEQVLNDYSQPCIRKSKQHLIKFLI